MIILVETDAGITGVGEGGSPDLVASLAPSRDREKRVGYRIDLAAHVHGSVLFAWPRKDSRTRRDRHGAVGHQGKALNVPLYMLCGGKVREHVQLYATRGLPRDVSPARPQRESGGDDGVGILRVPRRWIAFSRTRDSTASFGEEVPGGRGAARAAAAVLRGPGGGGGRGGQTFDSRARILSIAKAAEQIREGRRTGRQLVHRHPPEVRLPGGRGNLPLDRAVPAVLRRGSGTRGAVPDADSQASSADERAARAGRAVGSAMGVQHTRRRSRHRLRARDAAERRRRDGDAQDHGDVRHAQGRHRSALYRPGRHGRAHSHDDLVSRGRLSWNTTTGRHCPRTFRSSSISGKASAGRTIDQDSESLSTWRSSIR